MEKINCLQQKETELKQERKEDVELKDRINALNSEKEEQLKAMKEERKMHEESQRELERKLESLGSQLRTAEVEKKSSENEIARLQEQVQILEGSKEWELAGIGDTLNKTSLSVMELLAQQLPLNNQEQQLQGKKVDLEDKLKILISQLNATEEEKQILEGNKAEEIERLKAELERKLESSQGDNKKLQEQVEHLNVELEKVRSVAMSSVKAHTDTLGENYELKIQQVENSTAEDEQQNGKLTEKDTQEQTKAQGSSIISLKPASTKKSLNYWEC
ncbi:coiled-coil domain-containing protein [Wolbachia endosymbiont (group A) of Sympetrum striolatum]|uniref:hypothetical protein n=1 Tax=Wolbachia endosymbiont (group A) of Sympetrum striolatum TaxID=2954061 RepID=UPI0022274ECC|nr:hypothetical protein [Wolbachia endosymbiont (group A) of Sympetrum striolatum]